MKLYDTLTDLCRGEPATLLRAFDDRHTLPLYAAVIALGAGLYGATIGLWRAPLQALFSAMKFPALVFLTTLGNALLNGMIAQLMGLRISFRCASMSIAASFAIASLILGSLSPITFFMTLNTPPLASGHAALSHSFTLLAHVFIIAFAGVMGNVCLFRLLLHICGKTATARKVLFAWLAGNMFLGCQLSWIMRPFIGSPGLPVEFLRANAFQGNFYESVFQSLARLIGT